MYWKDVKPGVTVYHRMFTHWGKGVIVRKVIVPHTPLERGGLRVLVDFEHRKANNGRTVVRLGALLRRPNKKKINQMVQFYVSRGLVAENAGDRLIPPFQPTSDTQ